jgi:hypothetical protein
MMYGIINPWLKGDDCKSSPTTANLFGHISRSWGCRLGFFEIKQKWNWWYFENPLAIAGKGMIKQNQLPIDYHLQKKPNYALTPNFF